MAKEIDIETVIGSVQEDPKENNTKIQLEDTKSPSDNINNVSESIDVETIVKEYDEGTMSEGFDNSYDVAKTGKITKTFKKDVDQVNEDSVERILDQTEGGPDTQVPAERTTTYNEIVEGEEKVLDDIIDIDADGKFVFKMAPESEIEHLEKVFGLLNKGELQKNQGSINNFLRNTSNELFDVADYTDVFDINIQKKTMTIDELESLAAEIGQDEIYFKIREVREKGGSLNQAQIVRGMWEVILLNTKAMNLRAKIIGGKATEIDEENYKRLITQRSYVRQTIGNEVGDAARIINYQKASPEYNAQLSKENRKYLEELEKELADGSMTLRTFAMFEQELLPYQRNIFKKQVKEYLAKPKADKKKKFSFRHMTTEFFMNSLLSAPITHLANIAGNAAWNTLRFAEYAALAGQESIAGGYYKAIGLPYERTTHFNEFMSSMASLPAGFFHGGIAGAKTVLKGKPLDGMDKVDLLRNRTLSSDLLPEGYENSVTGLMIDAVGYASRSPTTALAAEDEFFKAMIGRMELDRIARKKYNQAIRDGFTHEEANLMYMRTRRLPSPEVRAEVMELAREATFTRQLPEGFFRNMQNTMNTPELKAFVPFYKTLVNISLETAARIPGIHYFEPRTRAILRGNDEAKKRMVYVKLASGTSLLTATMMYTQPFAGEDASFFITGAAPRDKDELAAFRRKNYREYSIMVRQKDGSYKAYDYRRIDPFGQIMGMSADYAYTVTRPGVDSTSEDVTAAAFGLLNGAMNFIEDQPITDGIEVLNIFSSLQGGDASEWFAENFGNIAGKLVNFYYGTYMNPMSALDNQLKQMEGQGPQDYRPTSDQIYEFNEQGDIVGNKRQLGVLEVNYGTGKMGKVAEGVYKVLNKIHGKGTDSLTIFGTKMPGPEVKAFSFSRSYQEEDSYLDDVMDYYSFYLPSLPRKRNGYLLTRDEYDKIIIDLNEIKIKSVYGSGKVTFKEELEFLFRNEDWNILAKGEDTQDYRTPAEQRKKAHDMMLSVYKTYESAAVEIYDNLYPERRGQKTREQTNEEYGTIEVGANPMMTTQPE
tara:strand:- start:146 stop:3295 length:3150 start_codon:yes stop_codon:yes gene_type:complete